MKAMLLSAGKGTRLLPLSEFYPKALFPVGDRPCIYYQIAHLREMGVKEIVVNLHHLGESVAEVLGDGSFAGIAISYSREKRLLGTGGGVRAAARRWKGEDVLVANADTLVDFDYLKLARVQLAKEAAATMALLPRPQSSPYTPVYLDRYAMVTRIGGEQPGPGYIFTGVQYLSPAFIGLLGGRKALCLVEDGYRKALEQGMRIAGMAVNGYWREIGTIGSYWEANRDFLRGKSPSFFYRGREDFTRRGIHAGKRSAIGPRVSFYYPVYLGDDCVIGEESRIGPTVLV
ncbi:MAG TPA: NDP-sugar synthase, partial [bacterium]|nr:NDP-sugar synthase [bacterium]